MSTRRVALTTLGCKLNQYDTEVIREQFLRAGYTVTPFDALADVYVVNTCTVTSKSDRDSRRLARRARRINPAAIVVVTGCYAQTDASAVGAVDGVDLVIGNTDKHRVVELVQRAADGDGPHVVVGDIHARRAFADPPIAGFADHTRAFVKIQDGCDGHCAYCIVPRARGPSRSRPPGDVLRQVRRLAQAGHREVILVGVHLGRYGRDLHEPVSLADLVQRITALEDLARVRLSSIEPGEVDDALIDLARGNDKVCPHFHIPLQSGADTVLRRMNRPYDAALYADLIRRLAARIPHCGLGADVMVGFPGETDEEFQQTRRLVNALPLTYLHVFSYSPRPGTPAADMPGHVQEELKKRRCRDLRAVSQAKHAHFCRQLLGRDLNVIVEPRREPGSPLRGVAGNYVKVTFTGPDEWVGRLICVRGVAVADHGLRAVASPPP